MPQSTNGEWRRKCVLGQNQNSNKYSNSGSDSSCYTNNFAFIYIRTSAFRCGRLLPLCLYLYCALILLLVFTRNKWDFFPIKTTCSGVILRHSDVLRMPTKFDTFFFLLCRCFSSKIDTYYGVGKYHLLVNGCACLQCTEQPNTGDRNVVKWMPFIEKFVEWDIEWYTIAAAVHLLHSLSICRGGRFENNLSG